MTDTATPNRTPTAADDASIEAAAAAYRLRAELEHGETRARRREGLFWSFLEAILTGLGSVFASLLPWIIGTAVLVVGIAVTFDLSLKVAFLLLVAGVVGLAVLAVANG
ncbi:hypothetical protein [Vannielia litorea]|uniref:hypothetical protein n=1 Tax=Vannielia litorea TaxID=1217970 RepID=UPI001BCD0544|nr:hypothetical protein [Vannielia litorea]MBS8226292.1 hypothetical protein [Vannielia litorea]